MSELGEQNEVIGRGDVWKERRGGHCPRDGTRRERGNDNWTIRGVCGYNDDGGGGYV